MDVTLQEAMLDNAREKEKRLDGSQCLKRKGTEEIKKHREAYKRRKEQHLHIENTNGRIMETLLNNIDITILLMFLICCMSQLVDGQDASNKENMDPNETDDGCIGMIHSMQTILMIYQIGYQVIQLLLIWHQRLHFCVGESISSFIYNERIIEGYLVCSVCFATILTQTRLCR
jgi:hypothetical protein